MVLKLWLPVPGYDGLYEVSCLGEVRSLDRTVTHRNGVTQQRRGVVLRQTLHKRGRGYWAVGLHKDGKLKVVEVHRLVLLAFRGPPVRGQEARHLDGDSRNNRLSNLAWGTRSANAEDRRRHGTLQAGDRHYKSKLSANDVRNIRQALADGAAMTIIAKRYGVVPGTIHHIANGNTWQSVN